MTDYLDNNNNDEVIDENSIESLLEEFDGELIKITMVDEDTGEEYEFIQVDEFEFEDNLYCLLLPLEDEELGAVFVRVAETEDGSETLVSLEEDEFDRVFEEYDRLCEEFDYDEEDAD
ncbi:MAG TPA: DUF1292 domain-containing protein [Clostridiaceae bacterium]|nr:DUF1292 domain-containing protein [Clostridiaceae bacterium]